MAREKKVVKRGKPQAEAKSAAPEIEEVDFYNREVQEALKRDADKDYALFGDLCNDIRKNLKDIHLFKQSPNPDDDKICKLRLETSFLFSDLKKLNRLDKHRLKSVRDSVNDMKQKVDNFHLQLQNLMYEVMHLQKEVTKCTEFRSKDEEINLVPVEEFYAEAPPEISRPTETKKDPHQLTLARLHWELEQRKILYKKLKSTEEMKQDLEKEIEKKKGYLENIQPTLKNILEATHPLHAELGMPLQANQLQHANAEFLSRPLYVLYVQSCAYREACDKTIEVKIEGSVEEAKALQSSQEEKQDEESGESDQEEPTTVKRHRRSVRESDAQSGTPKLLQKHPLTVIFIHKYKDYSLRLEFAYLNLLHIVAVTVHIYVPASKMGGVSASSILCPTSVLDNLFPEDAGSVSPNPSNYYQLKKNGLDNFDAVISAIGKPYSWVQYLAGLNFMKVGDASTSSVEAKHSVSRSFMEDVVLAIQNRLSSRVTLYEQLLSLENGVVVLPSEIRSRFPSKILSSLKEWKEVSLEEVKNHPAFSEVEEMGILQEQMFSFRAVIQRGSAKLKAVILISVNYPNNPPFFILTLQWKAERTSRDDDMVKELEKEVNLCSSDLKPEHSAETLMFQLQHLLLGLDIYLESESTFDTTECPREFSQDKTLVRLTRGRNRSRPYKYLQQLGLFAHRL